MRLYKTMRLPIGILLAVMLLLAAAPAPAKDPLPSWRGPVRSLLIDFITEATTAGGEKFIPQQRRIASFDLDGTLMSERPRSWGELTALHWLQENCGQFAAQGPEQAGLCQAAARGDLEYLHQHIGLWLGLPYKGMTLQAFAAYALKVFETYPNPAKKLPQSRLVYKPQLELIDLLHRKGFTVYVCSGTATTLLQVISRKYLRVSPGRCIGSRYKLTVTEQDGRLVFRRGLEMPGLVNLGKVKAYNLKLATAHGPVLAFGNTMGDAWMLRYAAGAKPGGLALLLNHDDPREFVYAKPEALALAKERGWQIVSMKRDWAVVFE